MNDKLGYPINAGDMIVYGNANVGLEICYVTSTEGDIVKVQRFNVDGTVRHRITELTRLQECLVLGCDCIPDRFWPTINELDHRRVS